MSHSLPRALQVLPSQLPKEIRKVGILLSYSLFFIDGEKSAKKLVKTTLYTWALMVLAASLLLWIFFNFSPVNNSLVLFLFHIPERIWLDKFSSIICFGNSFALGELTSFTFGFCQTVDSWLLSQMPSSSWNYVWQASRVTWYRKWLFPWARQNSLEDCCAQ